MHDSWLLESARRKQLRQAMPKGPLRAQAMAGHPVAELWKQLQRETVRQARVYTEALGDPGEITVETSPDEITIATRDGRQSTIRLDRTEAVLTDTFRDAGGAVRTGRPIINFRIDSAGTLAFNCSLHDAASALLRRLIR
jgi:hypothetical protein